MWTDRRTTNTFLSTWKNRRKNGGRMGPATIRFLFCIKGFFVLWGDSFTSLTVSINWSLFLFTPNLQLRLLEYENYLKI